ncbi:formate dehydrogenase subunit alpha [Capillimicrobium parvum]|uniref:Formate dehydrogenase H n=1 Tax=Capillimicrobium parvum TaxID=2884022 RepID=A0A9E6XTJ7_9ACTN|nr:formate dehydrogenase subunit alpha [Capillimicrobium parvum]UGS34310.1 Formate dehydrogenase H [Capillimicrobium parvum]
MIDQRFDSTVTTTCGYCGVGCRLEAHTRDGRVVAISPALDGPANEGHTCLKGRFAHQFGRHRQRLTTPLIREGDGFREATWDEALRRIVSELERVKSAHGPDAIAGLASSRATNEDCFAMQRLMRAAIGTNNIDNCSRVCHSPTSYAMRRSLGMSGATGSFADIDHADAAIIIGANPTEAHPVAGARIKQAALRGMKLVTIDPRRIELADYGVLHLSPRAGTNAAVMLGLQHVVARDGFVDHDFVDRRTEGYDELAELIAQYTPDEVQRITGVPAADIEAAAHIYAEAGEACVIWGLGVTEHKYGSEVVRLICNLALMTGKVGRPGSALLPMRGQNNVQGSSDVGALPDTYSGYRRVGDEEVARSFEAKWGVPLSREKGYTIPQMLDAAVDGQLKAMYIFGEDPAQTDPDTHHVVAALESLDFLVCQDIFQTETTKYADVILPAATFLEKEGTFINAERRIQLVEPVVAPPGEARTDLEILTTVSRALGHEMGYTCAEDVMDEIAALTPDFAGVTYERLGRSGLQWPVAPDGTDAPILYEEEFTLPGGKARFAPLPYLPPGSEASDEFPLVLVTGRRLMHYNAGTMTRRTANLDLFPSDVLEIHPDDAERLWISDGDLVSVRSPVGRIEIEAQVTDSIERGHVFTAFHFPEVRTNVLIGQSADVNTSCPEYKVMAVDVRPVQEEPSRMPALAAGD